MRYVQCSRVGIAMVVSIGATIQVVQAQNPLQAELRVLTHNVFGKNGAYCDQRAHGFGNIVAAATPAYDIVGVQEYYGALDADLATCDSEHLLNAIRCTGRYSATANSRLFYPEADALPLNEFDGGIGLFTMGTICDFAEMQFSHQRPGWLPYAAQGTILCRVQIPGATVTIDAYVTHLHSTGDDGCDYCCRRQQLQELRSFIAQHSQRSGNPVIVMGDFNIGGPPTCCGSKGYADIVEQLGNPRDLWLQAHACSQHFCGDTGGPCEDDVNSDCSRIECSASFPTPVMQTCVAGSACGQATCLDTVPLANNCNPGTPMWRGGSGYTWDPCVNELNSSDDLERIDYIFVIEDPVLSSSAFEVDVDDPEAVQIANFLKTIDPPGSESPFVGHVSDHLGVEATVQIRGRGAVWVDNLTSGTESGTSCSPFNTVAEGVAAVPSGDRVLIRSGTYAPPPVINRALTLQAVGGTVVVGR